MKKGFWAVLGGTTAAFFVVVAVVIGLSSKDKNVYVETTQQIVQQEDSTETFIAEAETTEIETEVEAETEKDSNKEKQKQQSQPRQEAKGKEQRETSPIKQVSKEVILEDYDLSNIKYSLFDGTDYFNYTEKGVPYTGKSYTLIINGLPEGLRAQCIGAGKEIGEYKIIIRFFGDSEHNTIPDREIILKIVGQGKEENVQTEPKKETATKPETEPKKETESETKPKTEPEKETEKEPETESEKEPETESEEETETNPEEHIWGQWLYKDENEDERTCSHCGLKQTQAHSFELIKVDFTDNQDGTHIIETTKKCIYCGNIFVSAEKENCAYGEWQYIGNDTEAKYCKCKSSQTRPHEHEKAPDDLEYVYASSNNDGTHKLEASYTCEICKEKVTLNKDEECDYNVTYKKTGVNDIHLKVSECKVCQHKEEEEEACVPVGELKLIKVYSQIYEYYDCELCGDWCQRKYHVNHVYGPWEYRDEKTHIRYCMCVEAREVAEHGYKYDKDNYTGFMECKDCGSKKAVVQHDHGYDTKDEMGLMQLISSPAYAEIDSASQVANPNPDPNEWCSRYEFTCKTCGVKYYIYYHHKFVNGFCTRKGYCGGIAEPTNIVNTVESADDEETVEETKSREAVKKAEQEKTVSGNSAQSGFTH